MIYWARGILACLLLLAACPVMAVTKIAHILGHLISDAVEDAARWIMPPSMREIWDEKMAQRNRDA